MGEFILDNNTRSLTDYVVTLPTPHIHANATSASPPFSATMAWHANCTGAHEPMHTQFFNREEQGAVVPSDTFGPSRSICASSGVASMRNNATHLPPDTTSTTVFGSTTRGLYGGNIVINTGFRNGWIQMQVLQGAATVMTSLPASTRTNVLTGQTTTASHTYFGLPVVGFSARTFANGTLQCGAGSCQGNYGGAFPLRYTEPLAAP
jgi:hypothetical protein